MASWGLSAHTWLAAWSILIPSIPLLASEVAEDETNLVKNFISKKIWTSLHVHVFTLWFYLKYSVKKKKKKSANKSASGLHPFMLKVKVLQSSMTLCDPIDYTVCRIFQARILEWGSSQPRDMNPCFPLCRQSLYQLSHKGSPYIPEVLAVIPWLWAMCSFLDFFHLFCSFQYSSPVHIS